MNDEDAPLDSLISMLPATPEHEEVDEFEEAATQTLLTCSGWTVTLGDDLKDCSKDLILGGAVVCCSPLNKERTDAICISLSTASVKVDWYWLKGRIIVKTNLVEGTHEIKLMRLAFEERIRKAYHERLIEDKILERRAKGQGHGRFDWEAADAGSPLPKTTTKRGSS